LAGYYINLDRSAERRARLEADLAAHSLQGAFARFSGVDGRALAPGASPLKPGEIGCFRSHLGALRAARAAGGVAHILEDDVIVSDLAGSFGAAMTATGQFDRFDILFTDTFLPPDLMQLRFFKQTFDKAHALRTQGQSDFRVLDISRYPFACASSYLVAPRALDRLIAALEAHDAGGASLPVDILFRALANQGDIRAGCVFPFITSVRLDDIAATTIEGRAEQTGNLSVLAMTLLRYAFFVDADIEGYGQRYLDLLPGADPAPSGDPRLDLMIKVIAFILSDRFEAF
jgi:GR25 family glycosyltransferase involved in LPS biosynthesis